MFELINLILSILTFVALILYASFTYIIAKDVNSPIVSATFKQIKNSHLQFCIRNHSKVETESLVKIKANTEKGVFEFKGGVYGGESHWILPPFMEKRGHFELKKDLINEENKTLREFVKSKNIDSIKFTFYLKYRKVKKRKWKTPHPQKWIYSFKNNSLWPDI